MRAVQYPEVAATNYRGCERSLDAHAVAVRQLDQDYLMGSSNGAPVPGRTTESWLASGLALLKSCDRDGRYMPV